MKQCKDCGEVFKIQDFPKNKNMKSGHLNSCKACKKKTDSSYYTSNKEECNRKSKERYGEKDRQRVSKYYEQNKDNINENRRFMRDLFPEEHSHQDKIKYLKRREVILEKLASPEGRAKANAINAKRRALKVQATPHWANIDKIKDFYVRAKEMNKITGTKYHVDHIIPLRSPIVCGLHCHNNLQILTADENRKKYNKIL